MNYDEWFESLNKNGRTTYFLGQEGKVSKEAWEYQQKKINELQDRLSEIAMVVNDEGYMYETMVEMVRELTDE